MTRLDYEIRPLANYAEMKRAVEFQRTIWGSSFDELVPAAVFWFASRIGAIAAGAFAGNDMVGLIFGVTGWDGERPIHWSDMLGVHPSARGQGIGFALKRYQRLRLLDQGVAIARWTFDPLESRNGYLNFARLGVTSREYIRDAYGASTSPLHRGIGTDRLVAEWRVNSDRVRLRMEGAVVTMSESSEAGPAETINPAGESARLDLEGERLWLRVPSDIQRLKEQDAVGARRWREQTRAAFECYFTRGYEVREVERGEETSRYLLVRDR